MMDISFTFYNIKGDWEARRHFNSKLSSLYSDTLFDLNFKTDENKENIYLLCC